MYPRKRSLEDLPKAVTDVWSCSKEDCNGWIRDDYSFEDVPVCRQCKSPMIRSRKEVPILTSSDHTWKTSNK